MHVLHEKNNGVYKRPWLTLIVSKYQYSSVSQCLAQLLITAQVLAHTMRNIQYSTVKQNSMDSISYSELAYLMSPVGVHLYTRSGMLSHTDTL